MRLAPLQAAGVTHALLLMTTLLLEPALPELQFAGIGAKDKFLGDRWSYLEAGPKDAPVIVALHGSSGNAMQWRFQLAALGRQVRVIAWNAPGYLLSDGFRTEDPGCRDYADALADFLKAVGVERPHLLAHNVGTRVAQCFAMHHPGRSAKLILLGAGNSPEGLAAGAKAQLMAQRQEMVAVGGYTFASRQRAEALLGRPTPDLVAELQRTMQAVNPRAFRQSAAFGLADGYSVSEVAAKLTGPVLLITGEKDALAPPDMAKRLHEALPKAQLEILPGVGTLPHFEVPEPVSRLILEFLRP